MAQGLKPEPVVLVDLSVNGQPYKAKIWNCGEGRWCLVEAKLPDGTRLPGSGREGVCMDALLEAHELVSAHVYTRIKRI